MIKDEDGIYHTQFVDVLAEHGRDGSLQIKEIHWPDGRVFPVEKTTGGVYAKSPFSGSTGKKYTVTIHGQKRDIYYAKDRFFVDMPGVSPEMARAFTEVDISDEDWQEIDRRYLNDD